MGPNDASIEKKTANLPSLPVIPYEDRCLNPHSHLLFEDLKRGSFHSHLLRFWKTRVFAWLP